MRAALLLLLAMASVATATEVRVRPAELDAIRAERFEIPGRLHVPRVELDIALADTPARGTEAEPAEMAPAPAPAGTRLHGGNWTYAATIRERAADAATGVFQVELLRGGDPQGVVWIAQAVPDPLTRESVTVSFDIGGGEPTSDLFVVRITQVGVPERRLTSGIGTTSADYVWRGEDQSENPTLSATTGEPSRIRIVNGEGTAGHDLRIRDPNGVVVAASDGVVATRGDEKVVDWTPRASGPHPYECRFHDGMRGTIEVTE